MSDHEQAHRDTFAGYIPIERLRALVLLLGPGELTPTASRQFRLLCEEYDPVTRPQPAPSANPRSSPRG